MTFIDIFFAGLLLYGLIKGLWKGLFAELAGLLSLLLGLFVAVKFFGFAGKLLEGHVDNPKHVAIAAFAITFIAVVAGLFVLAKVFTKMASFASLGWLNHILGGFFGLVKMLMIVSVSLNFFLKINYNNTFASQKTLDDSLFFYPVLKVSGAVFPVLEDWFRDFKPADATDKEQP